MKLSRLNIFREYARKLEVKSRTRSRPPGVVLVLKSKLSANNNNKNNSNDDDDDNSNTVDSLFSGHCWDLELVSLLARVPDSGSLCLLYQSNVCNLFSPEI